MSDVHLRLDLSGVGLEYSGSEAFYQRWVEPIVAATCARGPEPVAAPGPARPGAAASPPAGSDPAVEVFQPEQPARFRQFVAQVGTRAASSEQQVMAFGFYLWNYEKRDTFDLGDVESFFGLLQQERPDDLAEMIDELVQRKRFLESAGGSAWRLSTKGVNYVKNRLLGSV